MTQAPIPAGGAVEAVEAISQVRAYEVTEPYEHQATVLFATKRARATKTSTEA